MDARAITLAALLGACGTIPINAQPLEASNPALSFLPSGTHVDWTYWRSALASQSHKRAAKHAVAVHALPEIAEQEPRNQRGWNDVQDHAEFLSGFSRTEATAVVVRGALMDSVTTDLGRLSEDSDGDDGSIPLARHTLLVPGERLRLEAFIGDGPHGSEGSGSADYDFYYIGSILAGRLVTAQIRTPAGTDQLDTKVALYDAQGKQHFVNDNGIQGDPDSFLEARPTETGEYWVAVRGVHSDWPGDPFDSASGPKAGSEGPYTLIMALDAQDVDFYSFELEAGDILSAGAEGEVRLTALYDEAGTLRVGTDVNWSVLYPPQTPLYLGGNNNIALVAVAPSRHAISVTNGAGEYAIHLRILRSPLAASIDIQTLFIDFDGAEYDASGVGGNADAHLVSLRAMLEEYQLESEEDVIINVAMATVHENLVDDLATANNPDFQLNIRNSRDHADVWGDAKVSRVIVGGTWQALGLNTIGVSESVDVGNFALEETAVVVLDRLVNPNNPDSPSSVPFGGSLGVADVIGHAIGMVVSHEAGHLFANFHTSGTDVAPDVMDVGDDPKVLMGVGPDGILGTADDVDIDFGESPYHEHEAYLGLQDTRNAVAFGLSGVVTTAVVQTESAVGILLADVWPNPATTRVHVAVSTLQPQAVEIALYDVLGRRLRAQQFVLQAGESRLIVPVDGLALGVYLLSARGVPGTVTRPVVIAR